MSWIYFTFEQYSYTKKLSRREEFLNYSDGLRISEVLISKILGAGSSFCPWAIIYRQPGSSIFVLDLTSPEHKYIWNCLAHGVEEKYEFFMLFRCCQDITVQGKNA